MTYITCYIYSILFFIFEGMGCFSAWGVLHRSNAALNVHLFLAGARRGCHFVCKCPPVSVETLHHRVAVSGCFVAPFHPTVLIRTWRKSVAGDGEEAGRDRTAAGHRLHPRGYSPLRLKIPTKSCSKGEKIGEFPPPQHFADHF